MILNLDLIYLKANLGFGSFFLKFVINESAWLSGTIICLPTCKQTLESLLDGACSYVMVAPWGLI